MKKSLLAVAVFGAFASAGAQAQTSVTLFGVVDAAVARVSASGGANRTGMTNSGLNSSRLGVRGTEDLGGGLKAGFWIEGQLQNDTGTGNATGGGLNFQRRSTVSLMGGFGELRLGRDYTPIFWNTTIFDPFGTNGVGQSLMPAQLLTAGAGTLRGLGLDPAAGVGAAIAARWSNAAAVRASNSVGYFLPNLGGIYGQLMYAFGEGASTDVTTATSCGTIVAGTTTLYAGLPAGTSTKSDGNFFGGRIGFANGPIDVAVATGKTKNACARDFTATNFGASYNFGFVKPSLVYGIEKNGQNDKVTGWQLGATAPLGGGELRFAYANHKVDTGVLTNDSDLTFKKIALGYGYNLSRRTQAYGTFTRVNNNNLQTVGVSNNGLTGVNPTAGNSGSGFEFGVRHSF
jgi:predicted porin